MPAIAASVHPSVYAFGAVVKGVEGRPFLSLSLRVWLRGAFSMAIST